MKGSERLKECLRVILGKNLESLTCTFIHFNFLGWALLHLSYTLIFIALYAFLVKFGDLLPLFAVLAFSGFAFYFFLYFIIFYISLLPSLELSKPHACVICIALPANLAVVFTQCFCFFKKTNMIWLGEGTKG